MKALNNHYPCCHKTTGLHMDKYEPGETVRKRCPKCQRQYLVTFRPSQLQPGDVMLEFKRVP